jgi:GINS complex subunit 1
VQNAKRTQALPHLPPYQSELIRSVVREVRDLDNHLCMRRNKRCLLAYHRVRSDKLEEYCWNGVDVEAVAVKADAAGGAPESSLSPDEDEYVRQYSDLLAAYKGQWTDIDLTGSLEPPRDLFIDVRVLRDAGEIQTEYG